MMPWVKVDTRFPTHEKVLDIGPVAEALWLRALCYAGDHQTDGFVPAGFVRRMGDLDGPTEAAKLVAVGLWDEAEGGWTIHDYLSWQSSKAHMDDVSSKRAEAGRRGGLKRAEAAAQANAKQIASKQRSKPQAEEEQEVEVEQEDDPPTPQGGKPAAPASSKPIPIRPVDSEKKTDASPPGSAVPPAPSKSPPFDLFMAVCEEMGQDPAEVTGKARDVQLAAAKHLVTSGIGTEDARRLYRWLAPQDWVIRGGGVDLKLMAGQVGKWTMNGRPDAPPTKPPPGSETMVRGGGGSRIVPRIERTPEEAEAIREAARQRMADLSAGHPARSAGNR